MDNQQGQPPRWPPQSEQPPNWYPPNQGWGSPQYPPRGQEPPQGQRPQQNTQYPPQWQPSPPYPQQPNQPPPTYYPPQQYYQQVPPVLPPPPPKKKHTAWIVIAVVVGLLVICGLIGNATHPQSNTTDTTSTTSDVHPTDTPTPTPGTWTTVQTFTGNGEKKTSIFTVPNHWRIKWKCNPSSDYFGQYNVIIDIYNSDGTLLDSAFNTICQKGNTSGDTEEYQGGDVYLNVQIDGAWTLEVQELQ